MKRLSRRHDLEVVPDGVGVSTLTYGNLNRHRIITFRNGGREGARVAQNDTIGILHNVLGQRDCVLGIRCNG